MFGKRKGPGKPSEPIAPQVAEAAAQPVGLPGGDDLPRHGGSASRPPMSAAGAAVGAGNAKGQARRSEGRTAASVEGRKLVVGREICLSGEIKTCEKLVVEGKVEADLNDSQSLEISEPGLFRGNAKVEDCEISGTFEGELTVTGTLMVNPTGRVSGKIRYANLEVARGARLRGDIDSLDAAEGSDDRPARGSGPKLAHANTPPSGKAHTG
ncbi:MAG: polymer-forming cytoskeletal protein [Kiloniellaceae bacterium]